MNPAVNPPPLPEQNKIALLCVARDVGGIFILTALGGFVIGLASRILASSGPPVILIGLSNILLSVVGFVVAGCITRRNRWPHLVLVALGLWLVSAVNLAFGFSALQWVLSVFVIFAAMGLGGGIASAVARGDA